MPESNSIKWSETKGGFAVFVNGALTTYTATKEDAEDYLKRLSGNTRKKEAPSGE